MQLLQKPEEFLSDFVAEIKKSNRSILIQTMSIESGEVMALIEEELIKAVNRGVAVRINYDWVTEKFVHGDLPLLPVLNSKKRSYDKNLQDQNSQMLKRLTTAGVKISKTNQPNFIFSLLPFINRNHIKMYVIDSKKAWIGGINLFDVAFQSIDLMVKTDNQKVIEALLRQFEKINKYKGEENYSVNCGNDYSLFVDVGKHGKSIIYDEALSIIRNSKKNIIFMSQFTPDNNLLRELIEASKRNLGITIITSGEDDIVLGHYPAKLSYLYFKFIIKKYPNIKLINLDKHVHTKLLLVDQEAALFGSHNLTFSGVLFGTEEIMLKISNTDLLRQIEKYVQSKIEALNLL
jgi:phosphatidylserine/phosphatidylglycerophosphate/cardiolipin synthase-like enzyme